MKGKHVQQQRQHQQMWALRAACLLACAMTLLCTPAPASGFYLPGVAPRSFTSGEPVALLVNRLDSQESIIPFDYYSFDFCEPGEGLDTQQHGHRGTKVSENLGQVLLGERIRHGPYKIDMMQSKTCEPLCMKKYSNKDRGDVKKYMMLAKAIRKEYMQHWIVDNLPVVECTSNCKGGATSVDEQPFYRLGFPVGCVVGATQHLGQCTTSNLNNMQKSDIFINNHVDLVIQYHESSEFEGMRIVGVIASPRSIAHDDVNDLDCSKSMPAQSFMLEMPHQVDGDQEKVLSIIYTYGVFFEPSDIKWASRWDTYLRSAESTKIQWFSIVNSLVIVVFLSGMLGVILARTLYKDIARYNQYDDKEDIQEEFGWKLVHADVFRPPGRPILLSVFVGTGVQLIGMISVSLFFACLGFLSPATRGGLMTAMISLWVCFGALAGYASARAYKMMGGEKWKLNTMLTATLIPGVVFVIFFILDILLWAEHSSAAIPFGTLVVLALLWFGITLPLTYVGAYAGYKKPAITFPGRTNSLPRQVPMQPFYSRTPVSILVGGILPFGCIFVQLLFILTSVWGHNLYYVFGFLMIVFLILIITTIESTFLLCYFHLCNEDYHWWWRAFLTGGSSALYLFIYQIIFYFKQMEVDGKANFFLYAFYSLIIAVLYFITTGTIGFLGCLYFVRRIYGVLKVD